MLRYESLSFISSLNSSSWIVIPLLISLWTPFMNEIIKISPSVLFFHQCGLDFLRNIEHDSRDVTPQSEVPAQQQWTTLSLTSFSVNSQNMDDDVLTTLKLLIIGESGVGKSRWGSIPLFFPPFSLSRTVGWVVTIDITLALASSERATSSAKLILTVACAKTLPVKFNF